MFDCLFVYYFPDGFALLLCTVRSLTSFSKIFQKFSKKENKSFFSYYVEQFNVVFFTLDRLVNPPWKRVLIPFFCRLLWYVFQIRRSMVRGGDWL